MTAEKEGKKSGGAVVQENHNNSTSTNLPRTTIETLDLQVANAESKRKEILKSFEETFSLYENLFEHITEKGFYARADRLRHPLIFYFGHTAAFYINKLVLAKVLHHSERISPQLESLVSIGVDEMSWDDLLSDDFQWPSVERVRTFRTQVRQLVKKVITERLQLADNSVIDWEHPFWTILMGIEHERIHLETSTVLIRQLPLSLVLNNIPDSIFQITYPFEPSSSESSSTIKFINVEASEIVLGRPEKIGNIKSDSHSENLVPIYGWDNEYGYQTFNVKNFSASERLISNLEFFEFVKDNGYQSTQYWSEEGRNWLQFSKAEHPVFWVKKDDGNFVLRNMLSITPHMPWDFPVEVNCLEASAYCRWFSKKKTSNNLPIRLPSQEEYQLILSKNLPPKNKNTSKSNKKYIEENANIGLQKWASSCPVNLFKHGDFYDVMGNVWQWTRTPMHPFPHYKVHPFYDDFTTPTYDDKHNLIKGGSWISLGNEATRYSRYSFRRHFYQHAGFRIVKPILENKNNCDDNNNNEDDEVKRCQTDFDVANHSEKDGKPAFSNIYEVDSDLAKACEFHWGPSLPRQFSNVEHFSVVCAKICEQLIKNHLNLKPSSSLPNMTEKKRLRVLDLNCSVGRASFELAQFFDEVVGLDISARFIQVAHQLVQKLQFLYSVPLQGEIMAFREIFLSEIFSNNNHHSSLVESLFGPNNFNSREVQSVEELVKRLSFYQGDPSNLMEKEYLFNFDVVLAANLLEKLTNPKAFLTSIHKRILPGGYLVITSTYNWNKDITPVTNWIGSKKVDGENLFSKDALDRLLSPNFELIEIAPFSSSFCDPLSISSVSTSPSSVSCFNIPFVVRENKSLYNYGFSECTIWRKNH